MRRFVLLIVGLGMFTSPASAQEPYDPEVPRDLMLHEWLARFPDREDIRACVGRGSGEWTITLDASARAPNRARAQVRSTATLRVEPELARCLQQRLRTGLAGAALLRRTGRTVHDEHTFRALDTSAIELAYLERRRYAATAEQERLALAQCIATAPASRFPLRVPIVIRVEGGPYVDWPQPPPAWWIAEEPLRNCLSYHLGGVPHIDPLPFEHRFVVEVRRDGTVTIVPTSASGATP